jgi:sirohydrochlorin ferrochelatase
VTASPLILAGHGSRDPRSAEVLSALADQVRRLLAEVSVDIGFLDHALPRLRRVATPDSVVVPVLLTSGYHVRRDIPAQLPTGARVTAPVGTDRRIAALLARRVRAAGWDGTGTVTLAASGSADPHAIADVQLMAGRLGELLGTRVDAAFVGAGPARLADSVAPTVVSYLLAPGRFAEMVADHPAELVIGPIGPDPMLAEIIADRYLSAALGTSTPVAATAN